ncbi:hypothetical protein MA20_06955 [Bradyrhizobium japonicum]|uniref:Uncharacterized protein n=1 Tax=Bradyrhizobium japonicum TaxID=375 RepID=A0A0A3Y452_BRAJP|nr:hypothetical protein [Bradyrhizobium japonicum]KGT80349.1 hypothetical protein MA20_06955 [Bradyrhizobium japonicum]MCS3898673.1 hypothetical protein [Bradyrhizobium japonicum USDA 38]MCS3941726.1 hypothetical protein [Bradyrhizobium japonicum]MCW2225787.1 hypothetical protein [Bradyrhizobium japonicum]MCW2340998.1 hypothetical protein [Bradyrhizobium japonicum]
MPIAEWDVLLCKAIHPDGNAIFFDGKWTWLPLSIFYDRYCQHVKRTELDVLDSWKTQLRIAATRAQADADEEAEDDDVPAIFNADLEACD